MPSVLPDESFSGHELELLHDVSASIQAFSDLNELLRHILRKIKTAFDIEGASIALHDPAQKEFFFIRTVEEETQQAWTTPNRCGFRTITAWPAGFSGRTVR
jgi:nitrate/nitrite-specific signal transduction histidine kinase